MGDFVGQKGRKRDVRKEVPESGEGEFWRLIW